MNISKLDAGILKAIISNKKCATDFVSDCDTKLFIDPDAWTFSQIVYSYIKLYKDVPTLRVLLDRLPKNNETQHTFLKNAWNEISNVDYNTTDFKHDVQKLKNRFIENQLINLSKKFENVEPGNIDSIKLLSEMNRVNQEAKNLTQLKAYERKTLKESVNLFKEQYNAKQKDPEFDRGLMTGYSYLDSVTDGLRPGELLLIGGESGGGKSMFLMNMAIQMWMQKNNKTNLKDFSPGNSVMYFSLEMPFKPCLNRVLSRLAEVPSKKIRNASLNHEETDKLKVALRFVKEYPWEFEIIDVPRGVTAEMLEKVYLESKATFEDGKDPKIVVIDYLGIMDDDEEKGDDWLKLGKIAGKVHEFLRAHNLIGLSAVQLNRTKSKDLEDKIGMHRIGRSALIMTHANIGIQIETRVNEKSYPDMPYHIIKNRDGALGKGTLIKDLACGTLLDQTHDEDDTEFLDYDPDDISKKIELFDI